MSKRGLVVGTALCALAIGLTAVPHASAQEPIFAPTLPSWSTDLATSSMVLNPVSTARLALGLSSARARLQVYGENINTEPGVGYAVLGNHSSVHMKLDRNDIQVSGGSPNTVASLYVQRFGGPMVLHASRPLAERVYFPNLGGLGVGTADPLEFAISQDFIQEGWEPDTMMAIDGDIYSDVAFSNEVRVMDRLRVGRKSAMEPGAAYDFQDSDALVMVGGKLSAQEIIVHVKTWADDVFDEDYDLTPLPEVEKYVRQERHLPGIPSEDTLKETGMDVASTNAVHNAIGFARLCNSTFATGSFVLCPRYPVTPGSQG